jgi:hypothetical protein
VRTLRYFTGSRSVKRRTTSTFLLLALSASQIFFAYASDKNRPLKPRQIIIPSHANHRSKSRALPDASVPTRQIQMVPLLAHRTVLNEFKNRQPFQCRTPSTAKSIAVNCFCMAETKGQLIQKLSLMVSKQGKTLTDDQIREAIARDYNDFSCRHMPPSTPAPELSRDKMDGIAEYLMIP